MASNAKAVAKLDLLVYWGGGGQSRALKAGAASGI